MQRNTCQFISEFFFSNSFLLHIISLKWCEGFVRDINVLNNMIGKKGLCNSETRNKINQCNALSKYINYISVK